MGGGGKSTPAPKTFTPPPINDGPATNPIPNFFAQQQQRANPFAGLGQIQTAQPQNPFGRQTMTPEMVAALLNKIRGGG